MAVESQKEVHGFQAEVKQLLHLVVHSLYSNKEIFLRELISNASDALDKLRFAALSNSALLAGAPVLEIRIEVDKAGKTIKISDNGIGMSRDEIISHLGTIAHSGTKNFLASLTGEQSQDARLIGQFGVGFYSAFIVADKVEVISRRADLPKNQAVRWESAGVGDYTVETVEKEGFGSDVILHLKSDEESFLEEWQLKNLITKYSDHIGFPILMKKEEENATLFEQVNKATALWTLSTKDITDLEYQAFYKHISHDAEDPLAWMHNKIEGKVDFTSLLYIPRKPPYGLWLRDAKHGLKLYVQRVFILDDVDQFLPNYLRFIKGVIDSNDLPLNVSRELLQDSKSVEVIRSTLTRRVLGKLEQLARENKTEYQQFWDAFGMVMKEGPAEDFSNREQLARLLRFSSTFTNVEKQDVSLEDYVSRMKPDQTKIYYIAADSFSAAKHSPHLEYFRKNQIEVILLFDRIDEWFIAHLHEFGGKPLHSVAQGALSTEEAGKQENETLATRAADLKTVLEKMKSILGARVKDVRLTERLTQSLACLVADENELTAQMERLLKSAGQKTPETKRILEINPEHLLIQNLKDKVESPLFTEWAMLIFEQAVLAEGGQLEDPASFVNRMNQLLQSSRGV